MMENLIAGCGLSKRLSRDVDDEISDEEARETTLYDMYFPCYERGRYGTIKEFDEERKERAVRMGAGCI